MIGAGIMVMLMDCSWTELTIIEVIHLKIVDL